MANPTDKQNAPDPESMFTERYLSGVTPWDSGITPPELMAFLEDAQHKPGRALDLGCGTGTNCVTMAEHGWRVLGVDFAQPAVDRAEAKAHEHLTAIASRGGSTHFLRADVTTLDPPPADARFDLIFDLGCLNGIPVDRRPAYAQVVRVAAAPGALYMLYAHMPRADGNGPHGCTTDELDALFGDIFTLENRVISDDNHGGQASWNWYRAAR